MNDHTLQAIERVARWHEADPLNQCSNAVGELITELNDPGVGDKHRVQLVGPRPHLKRLHPDLVRGHQVLQVGDKFADVTWKQIDTQADVPWRVYSTVDELHHDWESAAYLHSERLLW